MVALSVAVIMAVLDATRSIAASQVVVTPLAASWGSVSPATLAGFEALVRTNLPGFAWDPVVATLLSWPGFAVFCGLALILYAAGRRPARSAGRFVLES